MNDTHSAAALVVGAAILREGRLLAARRTTPRDAAGRWELPGGKVEPREAPSDALVREVREELGCAIVIDDWLDGEHAIGDTHILRAATCRIAEGEPRPGADHDRLRWLGSEGLGEVDWLDPDRRFLAQIEDLLRARR